VSIDAVTAPAAVGSDSLLRYLPVAIRRPERPFRAIAIGWLTAFPASILFAVLGAFLMPDAKPPEFHASGGLALFALVIFSPVLETLIMGGVLLVLLRLFSPAVAILLSAIGWGIAHSTVAVIWGLVIWWPFLVFSTLFVTWRQRSLWLAFGIPMCVHALQNLIPAALIAFGVPI
jgi:membrane protease YdiL (CAAX protease family)